VYWSVGDSGEGCAIHPNHLYAADQATGKLLWQADTDDDYSIDAMADGLIFGSDKGGLSARRASDGVLLWQASDLGFIHADRQVMLAERRNSDESELLSLDPTSGKDLWAVADTNDSYNVFRDDELYGVKYTPGTRGHLSIVARTLSTGGIHWEATLPLNQKTGLAWRDSKLLALQADYHACSGGITSDVTVTAFDAATGHILWMRVLPRIAASETPVPSPTIHARMLC
jgi:outer membrane protein assembly factor BamB